MEISIHEKDIIEAARKGNEAFVDLFAQRLLAAVGGELTAETMGQLTADQITLLAYQTVKREVMEGGFIQLIYNGYGPFIFLNPFAKAMRLWGEDVEAAEGTSVLHDFSKLVYKGRKLFERYGDELTQEMTDEEFMASFELHPEFDELDDAFVEDEEAITSMIAVYIDKHIEEFVEITT